MKLWHWEDGHPWILLIGFIRGQHICAIGQRVFGVVGRFDDTAATLTLPSELLTKEGVSEVAAKESNKLECPPGLPTHSSVDSNDALIEDSDSSDEM